MEATKIMAGENHGKARATTNAPACINQLPGWAGVTSGALDP
jgi:hypothetical protein